MSKTLIMAISFKSAINLSISLKIGNETIQSSKQIKILGAILNNEGTLISCANNTIKQCHSKLAVEKKEGR